MGFDSMYEKGSPKNPHFKRNARISGCIYVALGFLAVLVIGFLANSSKATSFTAPGGLPVEAPLSDSSAISAFIGGDKQAVAGMPYQVSLVVYNATDKSQKVTKITISQMYLSDSVQVRSVSPEFRGSRADEDNMIYVVQQPVEAYDTVTFDLVFLADGPGTHSGTIGACFFSGFCAESPIETVVGP